MKQVCRGLEAVTQYLSGDEHSLSRCSGRYVVGYSLLGKGEKDGRKFGAETADAGSEVLVVRQRRPKAGWQFQSQAGAGTGRCMWCGAAVMCGVVKGSDRGGRFV